MRHIIIFMGLFTLFSGLVGCRPSSGKPDSSQQRQDGRIDVTAEFNHKIGPIERGEKYEDPLEEALRKHSYGETDGGGTTQSKEGEIEFIDVHMLLISPEKSIPF